MAGKKYYAVKKGKMTGIFKSWEECRASVDGYPGAEYKGFQYLEEAEDYLSAGGAALQETHSGEAPPPQETGKRAGQSRKTGQQAGKPRKTGRQVLPPDAGRPEEVPGPGTLLAYVDGSYDNSLKKYAFGCVFLTPDGGIDAEYGNGDNAQSLQHRNVTGEMLGAMYAVKTAMMNGFGRVEIRYDYEGIEKWVTGQWRSRTELTGKYARAMRDWGKEIEICFTKVAAHSNVYYNELADRMAKKGLRDGLGIPKVRMLRNRELQEFIGDGTD